MNDQLIAEVLADSSETVELRDRTVGTEPQREEEPFYIVPPPPIPGRTCWSIAPC